MCKWLKSPGIVSNEHWLVCHIGHQKSLIQTSGSSITSGAPRQLSYDTLPRQLRQLWPWSKAESCGHPAGHIRLLVFCECLQRNVNWWFFGVYELEELGKFSYVLVFKWLLNPREQWSRCTSGSRALYVFFLEVVPSPQTFQREEFPNKVNISVRSHINLTLLSLARLYIQPTKARINQMAMGMWPTVIYDQWP